MEDFGSQRFSAQEDWEWTGIPTDEASLGRGGSEEDGLEVCTLHKGKGRGKGKSNGDCYKCGTSGHSAKCRPSNPKGEGKRTKGKGSKGEYKGAENRVGPTASGSQTGRKRAMITPQRMAPRCTGTRRRTCACAPPTRDIGEP